MVEVVLTDPTSIPSSTMVCDIAGDTPEMIDSQQSKCLKRIAEPIRPPPIIVAFHRIPIVQRVAPELAIFAEVIGRYTCDRRWPAVFFQQKQVLVCPDVCAAMGDENGHIAEESHIPRGSVIGQLRPLLAKYILNKLLELELYRQLVFPVTKRGGISLDNAVTPFRPIVISKMFHERGEKTEVIEPAAIVDTKRLELIDSRAACRASKLFEGSPQSLPFDPASRVEVTIRLSATR